MPAPECSACAASGGSLADGQSATPQVKHRRVPLSRFAHTTHRLAGSLPLLSLLRRWRWLRGELRRDVGRVGTGGGDDPRYRGGSGQLGGAHVQQSTCTRQRSGTNCSGSTSLRVGTPCAAGVTKALLPPEERPRDAVLMNALAEFGHGESRRAHKSGHTSSYLWLRGVVPGVVNRRVGPAGVCCTSPAPVANTPRCSASSSSSSSCNSAVRRVVVGAASGTAVRDKTTQASGSPRHASEGCVKHHGAPSGNMSVPPLPANRPPSAKCCA